MRVSFPHESPRATYFRYVSGVSGATLPARHDGVQRFSDPVCAGPRGHPTGPDAGFNRGLTVIACPRFVPAVQSFGCSQATSDRPQAALTCEKSSSRWVARHLQGGGCRIRLTGIKCAACGGGGGALLAIRRMRHAHSSGRGCFGWSGCRGGRGVGVVGAQHPGDSTPPPQGDGPAGPASENRPGSAT